MQHQVRNLVHIVDDNSFIREFLEELLDSIGYNVKVFPNAKEYIKHFNSDSFTKPLATFVDVIMPSMNGYEMIAYLQEEIMGMRFVIMSGEHDIKSEYKHLACMFLKKPFYPTCVETIMEKMSACASCGASSEIGCNTADHRDFYEVKDWICPSSFEVKLTQPSHSLR